MRVAFFGSANTIFTKSYINLLNQQNHEVLLFNNSVIKKHDDSINYNAINFKKEKNEWKNNNKRIIKKIFKKLGLDNKLLLNYLIEKKEINSSVSKEKKKLIEAELLKFQPEIIIFFWGTTLRSEVEFVDKISNVKKCLIINTYPTRQKFKSLKCNPFSNEDKEYFNKFEKIIFPSDYMLREFLKFGYIHTNHDVIVNPDFIFQPNICLPINNKNKKLIFLGNTDFSQRKIDDISSLIINLANHGIKVYMQDSSDTQNLSNTQNIHTFKPFTFDEILEGKLTEYISTFDGVLYAYNDVSDFRYHSSITTRLLLAENSNVPVYIYGYKPEYINEANLNMELYNFSDISNLVDIMSNKKCCVNSEYRYHERLGRFNGFISS
ncbi:TPA: hypothetical protein RQK49_001940 [Vibrio vulnificus]|nr:hypothetical protein [Vibrio vulnificus]